MSSSMKVMVKSENDSYKELDVKSLAKKCFAQGNYEQARKFYEFILVSDPEDVQTLCNLAKVLFYLQDYSLALRNAAKAINLEPDYDQAYHIAAKVAEKQDNMFMCEEYLKLGLERCYNAPILRDYYDKVQALKTSQRAESSKSSTPGKNSVPANPPVEIKKTNEEPKASKPKPKPNPGPSIDDCPELVTDSESDDESDNEDLDFKCVSELVQKANKGAVTTANKEKGPSPPHQDEFMKTVISVAKEKNLTYEDVANNRVQKLKTICKEGSEAFLEGINRKSVEKYKEAYDMIDDMPLDLFKMKEEDYAVLRYMICLLKIKSANYESIVSAITVLKEIEEKQARALPCVYYLLGLAYQSLNRNKFAVEYIEKGLSFLEKDIQFECQPYPQVYEIIPETRKENLQEKLQELLNISRTYRQPDAVCRYSRCLSISNHVIPSRDICYSDPDFTGYVCAICEEHCKISFHLNCWRSWKEGIADGRKVTDKDVLGSVCFTEDCVIDSGSRSIIVQIDIIGTDGQVKSSVKSSIKRDKSVTKKDKRTESVSEKSASENTSKEKVKRSESVNQDKSTPEPAAKEKVEKAPVVKKPKKVVEAKPKNKEMKDVAGSEELVKVENDTVIDLNQKLERLKRLRKIHFGYKNENGLDPEKIDYGISMDSTQPIDFGIVTPDSAMNCQIEFILSMYYDYLKSDGPRKKSEVIKKWDEQKNDLDPNFYIRKNFRGICELLLESYHFCQVGPYITTSKQVHIAFELVQKTFEDCEGKSLSESEDLTLDAHLFSSVDNKANDLKSHPPDNIVEHKKINSNPEVLTISDDKGNNKTKINTPTKINKAEIKKSTPVSSNVETKLTKPIEAKSEIKNSAPANSNIETKPAKMETKAEIKKSVPASNHIETKSPKPIEVKTETKKSVVSNNVEAKPAKPTEVKSEVKKSVPDNNLESKTNKPVLTKPSPGKLSVPHSKLSQLISIALDDDQENLSFPSKVKEEVKKVNTEEELMNLLYPDMSENNGKVENRNENPESEPIDEEMSLKNPFFKALNPKNSEMEGVKKKSTNPEESAVESSKGGLSSDINTTSKRNIFSWLKSHDSEIESKSSNLKEAGGLKNDFNFPPAKESNDLNKGSKVTSYSSSISKPIVLVEKFSQTKKTETQDCSCQTKPLEDKTIEKDTLIEEYKNELEEWKEKNKNLEMMLVQSYNNSAQLMDELENAKSKYKKALEERATAIEKRNEIIKQLKETNTDDKVNENLVVIGKKDRMIEQLKKAYGKSERDLMELRKQIRESKGIESSESKILLDDLQATEELLLIQLKEYSQLFERDFMEKAVEKLDALTRTVNYCTDDTQPSKNQVLLVKKKWEEVQSDITTKMEEFNNKLVEISEKIADGERIKNVTLPPLPFVTEEVYDPIPALINKLLEDNNKLASIVAQHVPQGLLSLRGCLVDMKRLQGQARPPPPAPTFFPVYQPQPTFPVQLLRPFPPIPQVHMQPPRPFPPPLMSVSRYAVGVSLVYQQNQATSSEVVVKRPPRSDSVSSNKSDGSVKSTSSSISDTKVENKIQNDTKNPDIKKIEPNNEDAAKNENKGARPKTEVALKTADLTSPKSPKKDKTSKLKAATSTLTPVNSTTPSKAVNSTNSTNLKAATSTLTSVNSISSSLKSSQQSTIKTTNTYKLFAYLGKHFPNTTDKELERCLTVIRKNNQGTLQGLDLDTITEKVREQLKLRAKNLNSLGFVKYSGPAWGTVKEENIDWNKNEHEDYDCVICFEKLTEVNFVQLACKHEFHETCIKKWFKEATVCPTCKRRCLLTDEYPPLA